MTRSHENTAPRRSRRASLLVKAGVIAVLGGEAFCLLGPIRYERAVHVVCHGVLYAGIALVASGAVMHWWVGRRGRSVDRKT